MVALLIWLAGAALLVYEITARHWWGDFLPMFSLWALGLWVIGGAAMISRGKKGALTPSGRGRFTQAELEQIAKAQAIRQAQPGPRSAEKPSNG